MSYNDDSGRSMAPIDGVLLRHAFDRGAQGIAAAREHLNQINVFPVADGDTGTNLATTLTGALSEVPADADVGVVVRELASSALMHSVGNSGIIMAQFLDGLAEAVGDRPELGINDFGSAAAYGVTRAYQAVSVPMEGTMLTVMQVWAHALPGDGSNAVANLDSALAAAEEALEATVTQLPALSKAGVIDAGAAGFLCFVRGMHQGLTEAPSRSSTADAGKGPESVTAYVESVHPSVPDQEPGFRYCTEIIIDDARADAPRLRAELAGLGDSLIVAGHEPRMKVHLHCDQPEEAAQRLARHGRLGAQKVDDMRLQHAAHHRPLAEVALVTDTACDLPQALLDRWQIHQVPLSIQWNAEQYLDRRTLSARRFYTLLEQRDEPPRTSQPPPQRFERLYRSLVDSHGEILSVHLSGKLSGTLGAAQLAAKRLGNGTIRVVDGRQLTTGLGLVVLGAAEAIAEGADAAAAATLVDALAPRTEVLVAVKSLDAMVRGGRISPLKGYLARRLGLLPIISLDREGRSCLRGKAFSFEGAVDRILRRLARQTKKSSATRWAVAHADAEAPARELADRAATILDKSPAYLMDTSPIIGAHAGNGSVCVSVQWSDVP